MHEINIKEFKQEYENQVIEVWNNTLNVDLMNLKKFRKLILYDDNFDSSLAFVALEGKQVIGFILGTKRKFPYLERGLEPIKGWVNVLFVKEEYQNQGIGTNLLNIVEIQLIERGALSIILGAYSPNYIFPGIDVENYPKAIRFFEKKKYIAGEEAYSMCKDLHNFKFSDETISQFEGAKKRGFSFRNYKNTEALELLAFAKDNFGGGWKRNCLIAMQNGEAEDLIYLVTDQKDEIIGFAMRKIDGNEMRFGPIGIAEKGRNEGLGSLLFAKMQFEMASKGIYHLYFVSTDAPGRRFYERHGVKVFRTYRKYQKDFGGDHEKG